MSQPAPRALPLLAIVTLLTLTVASCNTPPSANDAPPSPSYGDPLHSLDWLVGTWSGDLPNGDRMQEHWIGADGGLMLGVNRTVRGPQAMAFEFLRIEARDEDAIVYIAQPGGASPGVEFTLEEVSPGRALFANPAHDFPQRITYTRVGDRLTARVEAEQDGSMVGFTLEWILEGTRAP